MTCMLGHGGDCVEKFCKIKNELKFEVNFTFFSQLLDFMLSTVIEDESRRIQIISTKKKVSTVTTPSQIVTVPTRGRKVASTTITATSATAAVEILHCLPAYILQENQCSSEDRKKKRRQNSWKTLLQMNMKIFIHATDQLMSQHNKYKTS